MYCVLVHAYTWWRRHTLVHKLYINQNQCLRLKDLVLLPFEGLYSFLHLPGPPLTPQLTHFAHIVFRGFGIITNPLHKYQSAHIYLPMKYVCSMCAAYTFIYHTLHIYKIYLCAPQIYGIGMCCVGIYVVYIIYTINDMLHVAVLTYAHTTYSYKPICIMCGTMHTHTHTNSRVFVDKYE